MIWNDLEILKQELRIIRSDFDDAKTRVVKRFFLSYQDRLILEKQKRFNQS
jgi:hypothetical protein